MRGVHTGCPPSPHALLRHGGSAAALPCRLRGEGAVCRQALAGPAGKGFPPWHQHQRNAPQCSRGVLETSQHASCESSAPARPPAAARPGPSGSSRGPACQSRGVLQLRRLQVDSLMLQACFVLQPLSRSGAGPRSPVGRGGVTCSGAANPRHPASSHRPSRRPSPAQEAGSAA